MTNEPERSKAETIKEESRFLRGTIAEELAKDTTHFSDADNALLKFHGTYGQDDRDARKPLLAAGKERAYSMMLRAKIPGGLLDARQYLAMDDIASRYANQTLRITTRQGFQRHGVIKKDLQGSIRAIHESLRRRWEPAAT